MTMARSVREHLTRSGVEYDVLQHTHSDSSRQTATRAHVPASQLAKAVLTRQDDRYLLCVIPADYRLVFSWLNAELGGHYQLASESELAYFFDDCEVGAVPALGQAYGCKVVWDERLADQKEIFLESGDHENLIHVDQCGFLELMGEQEHLTISCPDYEAADFC